jgi:hypothetical protein
LEIPEIPKMDEDYERKLLDSGSPSFEQLQYAVKAAQIA